MDPAGSPPPAIRSPPTGSTTQPPRWRSTRPVTSIAAAPSQDGAAPSLASRPAPTTASAAPAQPRPPQGRKVRSSTTGPSAIHAVKPPKQFTACTRAGWQARQCSPPASAQSVWVPRAVLSSTMVTSSVHGLAGSRDWGAGDVLSCSSSTVLASTRPAPRLLATAPPFPPGENPSGEATATTRHSPSALLQSTSHNGVPHFLLSMQSTVTAETRTRRTMAAEAPLWRTKKMPETKNGAVLYSGDAPAVQLDWVLPVKFRVLGCSYLHCSAV